MRKFKCPKCGCVYTGKKDICPSCGIPLHYHDDNIKAPTENVSALPTFHFDAPDVLSDGIEKDEEFEKKLEEEKSPQNKPIMGPTATFPENGESYFDGWIIQRIGWRLLGLLVCVCTAFIALPWAACFIYRWETKHTVIQGRRLAFNGKGGQLFGRYMLWFFISIVTVGIFIFWIGNKLKKWRSKHTVFAPFDERDLHYEKDLK